MWCAHALGESVVWETFLIAFAMLYNDLLFVCLSLLSECKLLGRKKQALFILVYLEPNSGPGLLVDQQTLVNE